MSKLDDYNKMIISKHSNSEEVRSISDLLREYIRDHQRVRVSEAHRYVYRVIGKEYECSEFDAAINRILCAGIGNGYYVLCDGHYISKEIYNKYKDIFDNGGCV